MNRPNRATARNVGRKTTSTLKKVVAMAFLAAIILAMIVVSIITSVIHSASC